MVQLNRIHHEGLDRRYILDQITRSLDDLGHFGQMLEENEISNEVHFYTSEDAKREIESSGNIFMKAFTGIAFKHKERIKTIPILGDYAVRIKEGFLTREGRIKDVSHLLLLDVNPFIHKCYQELLNREADPEGFAVYQKMICEGVPKEAIIHVLANSVEFNGRFLLKDGAFYKKCYDNYKIKNAVKRTPGLNYLLALIMLPVRVQSLISDTKMNEANRREQELHQFDKQSQIFAKIDKVERHQASIIAEINEIGKQEKNMLLQLKQHVNDSIKNSDMTNQALVELRDINRSDINTITQMISDTKSRGREFLLEMLDQITQEQEALRDRLKHAEQRSKTVINSGVGVTVVQTEDFLLGVPSEEWRLAMYLSVHGVFEYGSEKLFKSLLHPRLTVVDVGSNLGIYTLHAVKAGCKVYSYEPTPSIFRLLNENIRLNGFTESKLASTNNLAVGEEEKDARLTIVEGISGWNNLFSDENEGKQVTVPVVALDHHLPKDAHIDIVKIDVEGGEIFVLRGMQRIIAENPDIKIFVEFAPEHLMRAKVEPLEFLSEIRSMGFVIQVIDENSGELLNETHAELLNAQSCNLFLSKVPIN